ncbi:MAG: 4-alpha-glucanotransferase [Pseudolabrys sp.]
MDDLAAEARRWGVENGYHDVFGRWHEASAETQRRLVAALSKTRGQPPELTAVPEPVRAFQGDGRRHWALAVQLYALRSRRNWGHGDFGDLACLIELAARRGAAAIGLNPLHALFPDRAQEASPYAPNSRIFLNPLYINVETIAEFPGAATAGIDLDALRAGELIDYTGVARAKLDGLRVAYEHFETSASDDRRAEFTRYRQDQGERLLFFSCFEQLRARFAPRPWPEWPAPWRHPTIADLQQFREAEHNGCEFHEFVQWVADRQLAACKEIAHRSGMSVGLYLDVALGIHPYGADAWSQQESVLADVSVGAPPDEFNPNGQDWGLAPFNPAALAACDFAPLRQLMRAAMRHAGAVRLDHVLGLKRLFMIPRGNVASDGTYVRFPFEQSLQVIAQVSQEARCVVIGEDLGTVPEGLRDTLARWGLWRYLVMLFERERDGRFHPPEWYPAEALATFNTHDLPSLRGWLDAHDLRTKRGLGLDSGESDGARAWAHQSLRQILAERAPERAGNELAAVASVLAKTPSRLVAIALDDIVGEREQINIPGTVDEHPNWRRKLSLELEDLEGNAQLRRIAEVFAQSSRN